MTVEKPKPKQLPKPITTRANSAMNQSEFLAVICNLLKAREKLRVHGAIGFGHWLKNWRESFKPIIKRSNRNHVITFYSHLKTALFERWHSVDDDFMMVALQWMKSFRVPSKNSENLFSCYFVRCQ